MDLNMPQVDGFQATERIIQFNQSQRAEDRQPVSVAAVTAFVNDQTI